MRKSLGLLILFAVTLGLHAQQLYFEAPRVFVDGNVRFPQLRSTERGGVLVYQELLEQGEESGLVEVFLRFSTTGLDWSPPRRIASGIRYEGASVPPVFDFAATDRGEILLAVSDFELTGPGQSRSVITLEISRDFGRTFRETDVIAEDLRIVNPRVFSAAGGGWYVVLEELDAIAGANRLLYSYSSDGESWGELTAFPVNIDQTGTQSDVTHIRTGNRDLFLFVGENIAALPGEGPIGTSGAPVAFPDLPQVYALYSDDSGNSWSAADPETGIEAAPVAPVAASIPIEETDQDALLPFYFLRSNFDIWPAIGVLGDWTDLEMQRPDVAAAGSTGIAMAFEAGLRFRSQNSRQLAYAELTREGNIAGSIELITAGSLDNVRVSYNQPRLISFDGSPVITAYTDPLRGGDVEVYQRTNLGWRRRAVAEDQFAAFPTMAEIEDNLHILWHGRTGSDPGLPTRMVYLEPDQRVLPPVVRGANFTSGERSPRSTAEIAWSPRADASGVVGYSTLWTQDPDAVAPELRSPTPATVASFEADEDGPWYLYVRAFDRAGNWSPQESITYFRDTTPPAQVTFDPPPLDEEGYLASNTFQLGWEPPETDEDGNPERVARYIYDLIRFAGEDAQPASLPVVAPQVPSVTSTPSVSRSNYDNGLWALTVQAVDSVGNVGEPAVLYLRLNKYIPVTLITTVTAIQDPLGRYNMNIVGRGFTANGSISQVILDEDGAPPYDFVYDQNDPGFEVFDDRSMSGPLLENVDTGEYRVGLVHPERGTTFSRFRLSIAQNGTVKFGNFTVLGRPEVRAFGTTYALTPVNALVWVVVALLLAIALFSGRRVAIIAREGIVLRHEARALITGKPLAVEEKQRRVMEMQNQRTSLRVKFTFFIVVLIAAVVGGLAVGLGTVTLNSQRDVLVRGLKDRVDVLMESMVAPAGTALLDPLFNQGDVDAFPARTRAMDEALYATVTGPVDEFAADQFAPSFNYVWGTNDPVLETEGEAVAAELEDDRRAMGVLREPVSPNNSLFFGRTLLVDPATPRIDLMADVIDTLGRERLGALIQSREIAFAQADALRRAIADLPAGANATELEQDRQRSLLSFRALDNQVTTGLSELVLDAAALVRFHTLGGAELSYTAPDDINELEADIAAAREALMLMPDQAVLLESPVLSAPQFLPTNFDQDISDHIFYQAAVEPDISALPTNADDLIELDGANLDTITYFRGAVRIGVATDLIIEQIAASRRSIIQITIIIAAIAIAAGVLGALLLATIVVQPINKLVSGVENIGRTKDKTKLTDDPIQVRSRDELFRLAAAVNDMSAGLAAAAEADRDLKATSELQKMFLPLEETPNGRKLTIASQDTPQLEFFGYYEGADALSGDYFTFRELKGVKPGHFAFIKCDVAGHGVRAAFMMAEVATMFENRVVDWNAKRESVDPSKYISDVNAHFDEFGFSGLFAAMTVGILDSNSGAIKLSHGGDNEQRFFRSSIGKVEEDKLPGAPATGGISLEILKDLPGSPFHLFDYQLAPGDIMILATDGIEESARFFRGDDYDHRAAEYPKLYYSQEEFREIYESAPERFREMLIWDNTNQDLKEEFSTERMVEIIEQVMMQGSYRLERYTARDKKEVIEFDYSGLPPTSESLVTAVMAAEKVFRIDRAPLGAEVELVRVDTRLNEFMKERLNIYTRLFGDPVEDKERPDYDEAREDRQELQEEYVYFSGLIEEVQSDDLTILAVRKK
jgi:serine phosphatase RsbU (regulator of sigma subunit)